VSLCVCVCVCVCARARGQKMMYSSVTRAVIGYVRCDNYDEIVSVGQQSKKSKWWLQCDSRACVAWTAATSWVMAWSCDEVCDASCDVKEEKWAAFANSKCVCVYALRVRW
jgi:hypothetical protein